MRVVLDATVWVSGYLRPASGARAVIEARRRGVFTALYCGDILIDVGNALVDVGEPENEVEAYLNEIGSASQLIPIQHQPMGVRDLTDNIVLETAITGGADYLVTWDKDLHELSPHVAGYVAKHGLTIIRDTRKDDDEPDFCTVQRSLPVDDNQSDVVPAS